MPLYETHTAHIESLISDGLEFSQSFIKDKFLSEINVWAGYFADGFIVVYNIVKNLIIGIIVSVYLLVSKEKFSSQFKKLLYAIIDNKRANIILKTARKSNSIFSGFISGKIIDSLLSEVNLLTFKQLKNNSYA